MVGVFVAVGEGPGVKEGVEVMTGVAITVLKMANKRSLVAAVLNATAASDIFTQDIEDMDLNQSSAAGGNTAASSSPTLSGADRTEELKALAAKTTITLAAILAKAGCKTVEEMSDEDYADACAMLKAWKPKAKAAS